MVGMSNGILASHLTRKGHRYYIGNAGVNFSVEGRVSDFPDNRHCQTN
jgi:hypothetical protein